MIRLLFFIAFLIPFSNSFSQELTGHVAKKKVLIGEPVTLTYSVRLAPSDSIRFEPNTKTIDVRTKSGGGILTDDGQSIEIREAFNDSSTLQNGNQHWVGQYTVVVWDSGRFIIPGPKISINDSTYYFRDIEISSDFSAKQNGIDLYDIREEYAQLPPEESAFIVFLKTYWWLVIVLLIVIALVVFLIRRNRPQEPIKVVKAMSLKERTLKAIDALESEKMWEKDRLKEHFIELSYILRSYLTARYDISILEKTTYQTQQLLLQNGLNEDTVAIIVRILSQSDMVKFAKSKPELVEILKIATLARQIVAETSPLEFDNYE